MTVHRLISHKSVDWIKLISNLLIVRHVVRMTFVSFSRDIIDNLLSNLLS